MITIGLVGGVASGKSAVACEFQKFGAAILNGDRIGHEVLTTAHIKDKLVSRWGKKILKDDAVLDRSAVAEIVFSENGSKSNANLEFLESVTHPEIRKIMTLRLEKMRQLNRFPMAVLDAAVMLKAGWDSMCDRIVFVDAPVDLRRKRAQLRGMTMEQFEAREAAQIPIKEKMSRADIVIDNSGPPQNTFRQVKEAWHSLLQIA